MAEPTKLNGKQIKPGSIILSQLFSSLGLGSLDDGKALVYTHTPTPVVDFQNVKFTKLQGVPGVLTPGLAAIINPAGDGIVTSPFVRSLNGGGGDIILNNTDQITEGATNKYFSGKTTDDLTEGSTNKYFSGKTTTNLAEGTNLYWTDGRFDTRFGTAFGAKKLQDISNVDITGIAQGDLLQYDLANDKYIPFVPIATNIVLNPNLNDGSTNFTNVQAFLNSLNNKNQKNSYVLLTLTLATITIDGTYFFHDNDFNADVLIVSFDKDTGSFFITTPIAGTIFNSTNTPANNKVNIYVTGAPGTYQLKVDNQMAITKTIEARRIM